jgi:AcrR family transcriptional regulator
MTVASEIIASLEPRPSLRERKKLATRRALRRASLDLVAERGFAHVTVEDIAEAADVSPRTFFNYFPSKEAALFGADPGRTEALRLRLIQQSPGESALEALRIVLMDEARARTEELRELGGEPASQLQRMKASRLDPQLAAARAVADALAERLGTDPAKDPYPLLLSMAAMGLMRAALSFWATSGGVVPLEQLVDGASRALADGLPENCALRSVIAASPGTSPAAVSGSEERKDEE